MIVKVSAGYFVRLQSACLIIWKYQGIFLLIKLEDLMVNGSYQ